jgi:acylpyruvate hydrolase
MKIICIGRNYSEHAKELNNEVPAEPVFFIKPDTALLLHNEPFILPDFSKEIHHEVEVVVRINRTGKCIGEKTAGHYYSEIGLGIDFTARDLQKKCKEKGLPWEIAKAFDQSAPLGKCIDIEKLPDRNSIHFELYKNGTLVQTGNTRDMIFSIERIIAYVSRFVTLTAGDLIYTGTPPGVGPVKTGDRLAGRLEGMQMFEFEVK